MICFNDLFNFINLTYLYNLQIKDTNQMQIILLKDHVLNWSFNL